MSSDSSDDEDLEMLREATDDSATPLIEESNIKLPPSLRVAKDEDEQFRFFKVTPEFQNYVAKALSKKMEKYLTKSLREYPSEKRKKRKVPDNVKLLWSSKHPIDIKQTERETEIIKSNTDAHNTNFKNSKLKKCKAIIDKSELKSIVISSEDILNFKEIKHWSNRSKSPVFKYKEDRNGTLHFVEPEFK